MFETDNLEETPDHKQNQTALNSQQVSLPLITRKPVSRGEIYSQRGAFQKQKVSLPSLQISEKDIGAEGSQRGFDKMDRNQFAREIKEKLNFVLGEMQHAEEVKEEQDSEDFDFQAKINQNKQILKVHRLKKEGEKQEVKVQVKQANKNIRNQSLYQKRVKQYREQSSENKYLSKRKQTMKQKPINSLANGRDSVKQVHQSKKKEDSISLKQLDSKKQNIRKNYPRAMSQKNSNKLIIPEGALLTKNDNLFDGIQNFLQNPRENVKQQSQSLVGLTLLKAKRDIEDKIKDLNQKLGIVQNSELTQTTKQSDIVNTTVRDWRRVFISSQKLTSHMSDFDKQLQRINSLQEKNSMCLQKYLQHQKILMQIQLRKKQLPKKINIKSH